MSIQRARALLLIVVFIAFFIRVPHIYNGLPYFYHEDEAHHFNRVVNMVKNGEFNPHYFHKPSLHFYLRMPVVAVSFLWGVGRGHIKSLKEIRTEDTFGVGNYAFTASHPGIVKWNRALSVVFGLVVVVLTWALVRFIWENEGTALVAALFVALSPEMIRNSAVIGVDTLMAMLCLAAVFFAVRCFRHFSIWSLFLSSVVAGLAVSSKYNALPIMIMPLLVCAFLQVRDVRAWLTAIIAPWFGFLIGSPFILAEIPLFLDQLAYEIWHYGIEGHEGNSATPGIEQAKFYWNWLNLNALSGTIVFFALLGFTRALIRRNKEDLLLMTFPLLYFVLMSEQRANFTRNMIVFVPFVCIYGAIGLSLISERKFRFARVATIILLLAALFRPLKGISSELQAMAQPAETRHEVESWLREPTQLETAVSGELQLSPNLAVGSGVSVVSEERFDLFDLYQMGFDRAVLRLKDKLSEREEFVARLEQAFPGINGAQRVVKNPSVGVYRLALRENGANSVIQQISTNPEYTIRLKSEDEKIRCASTLAGEDYCWIQSRHARLLLPEEARLASITSFKMTIMSPWREQHLQLRVGEWKSTVSIAELDVGEFKDYIFEIPTDKWKGAEVIEVDVHRLHSPLDQGMTRDPRRLGVAVRTIELRP